MYRKNNQIANEELHCRFALVKLTTATTTLATTASNKNTNTNDNYNHNNNNKSNSIDSESDTVLQSSQSQSRCALFISWTVSLFSLSQLALWGLQRSLGVGVRHERFGFDSCRSCALCLFHSPTDTTRVTQRQRQRQQRLLRARGHEATPAHNIFKPHSINNCERER